MLTKESKTVLIQSLYLLGGVLVMSGVIVLLSGILGNWLPFQEIYFAVFHLGLLIWAMFMGLSLFSGERRDGGMEYLLTLPYTRHQLLWNKIFPRFSAVFFCTVIYWALMNVAGHRPDTSAIVPLLPNFVFVILCLSLFIIGVSFSIFRGSIVVSALGVLVVFFVYLGVIHLVYPLAAMFKRGEFFFIHTIFQNSNAVPAYMYFLAFTLLLGIGAAFIHAFKAFNLGQAKPFWKRYLKVIVPVVTVAVLVSLGWAYTGIKAPRKSYHLTAHHQLIETDFNTARVYRRGQVREISSGNNYWGPSTMEKGHYMYNCTFSRYGSQLIRVDLRLDRPEVEVLYNVKGNGTLRHIYSFKDVVAVWELQRKEYQQSYSLVVLQPGSGTPKKIKAFDHLKGIFYPKLFGAGDIEGKRYWLLYYGQVRRWTLARLWEDGNLEQLGATEIRPLYVNDLIISGDDNEIVFRQLKLEGTETIKTLPSETHLVLHQGLHQHLDHLPLTELYGGSRIHINAFSWRKLVRLDLQTLELEDIQPLPGNQLFGFFDSPQPGAWYFTIIQPGPGEDEIQFKKLYRLVGSKLELIKEFSFPGLNRRKDFYGISPGGLVLSRDGDVTVYRLPGYTELVFERLD